MNSTKILIFFLFFISQNLQASSRAKGYVCGDLKNYYGSLYVSIKSIRSHLDSAKVDRYLYKHTQLKEHTYDFMSQASVKKNALGEKIYLFQKKKWFSEDQYTFWFYPEKQLGYYSEIVGNYKPKKFKLNCQPLSDQDSKSWLANP